MEIRRDGVRDTCAKLDGSKLAVCGHSMDGLRALKLGRRTAEIDTSVPFAPVLFALTGAPRCYGTILGVIGSIMADPRSSALRNPGNCVQEGSPAAGSKYGIIHAVSDTSPRGAGASSEDETCSFGTGAGFYAGATASRSISDGILHREGTSDSGRIISEFASPGMYRIIKHPKPVGVWEVKERSQPR